MRSQTTKIWKSTLKKLRMLHALTGERMVEIMDRLVTDELNRHKEELKDLQFDQEIRRG